MKKNYLFISMLLSLVYLCVSCGSNHSKRLRYLNDDVEVESVHSGPLGLRTTGTACHQNPSVALKSAKNSAHYNLRSAVGNRRFRIHFEELERYDDDGQLCIVMQAQALAPDRHH